MYKGRQYKLSPEQDVYEIDERTGIVQKAELKEVNRTVDNIKFHLGKLVGLKLKKPSVVFIWPERPYKEAILAASLYKAQVKFKQVYSKTALKVRF